MSDSQMDALAPSLAPESPPPDQDASAAPAEEVAVAPEDAAAAAAPAAATAIVKSGSGGSSSSAKIVPLMTAEEPALNLAARLHVGRTRTPSQFMQPAHFFSRHAPGLLHPRVLGRPGSRTMRRMWALSCPRPEMETLLPLGGPEHRLSMLRAARSLWAAHLCGWLLLLAAVGDAALLVLLSGEIQLTAIASYPFVFWRTALLPQATVAAGGLLILLLTMPCVAMRSRLLTRFHGALEVGLAVLMSLPCLIASYFVVTTAGSLEALVLTKGDAHAEARAIGYLAVAAAAAFASLHQAALALGLGALLVALACAEAFALWYRRGGGTDATDSWASPLFQSLCLLAGLAIGGRLAYVREFWLRHEALLREEMRLGSSHATRLLAELFLPFPSEPAFVNARALQALTAAATPLNAKQEAIARAAAQKRAAERPQLGMTGGKSVVDLGDLDSEIKVAEAAARGAQIAISAARLGTATAVHHVGVVCVRVHGCDGGSTRGAALTMACERLIALCHAEADKCNGWLCVESRGPLMVFACGIHRHAEAAAAEDVGAGSSGGEAGGGDGGGGEGGGGEGGGGEGGSRGKTEGGNAASEGKDGPADVEAAVRSCALAVAILRAAARAKASERASLEAGKAWAAGGGTLELLSMNEAALGMDAELAIGVGVGSCLCGILRPSDGTGSSTAPRHVLLIRAGRDCTHIGDAPNAGKALCRQQGAWTHRRRWCAGVPGEPARTQRERRRRRRRRIACSTCRGGRAGRAAGSGSGGRTGRGGRDGDDGRGVPNRLDNDGGTPSRGHGGGGPADLGGGARTAAAAAPACRHRRIRGGARP